jgi:hypothetical protein
MNEVFRSDAKAMIGCEILLDKVEFVGSFSWCRGVGVDLGVIFATGEQFASRTGVETSVPAGGATRVGIGVGTVVSPGIRAEFRTGLRIGSVGSSAPSQVSLCTSKSCVLSPST